MGKCQIEEREAGRAYPRTCGLCGPTGKCQRKTVLSDKDFSAFAAAITPTRADLIAQRDALQAQIDALPPEPKVETVRFFLGQYDGRWAGNNKQHGLDTHYLDVTIIDGVPQGWTKIGGDA